MPKPQTRLPPLKALQAFEAAARHLSFKTAAAELCVTPTAVSHQVRSLEAHLGVSLFHRQPRALRLTGEGAAYAPLVIAGFQKLTEASRVLASDALEGELVVSTTPSFAGHWLVHRLPAFQSAYPGLSVRLLSSDSLVDFAGDGIDLAIRYGFGAYPNLHAAWVLDDFVAPVCGRGTAERLQAPADLLDEPLVHYEWSGFSAIDPSWPKWFRAVGLADPGAGAVTTFSDEHMCLQAAREGQGVALVSLIAAARDLETGRLALPFDLRLKNKSYYMVCPEAHAGQAKIQAFQDWLLDQADLFRDSALGQSLLEDAPGT